MYLVVCSPFPADWPSASGPSPGSAHIQSTAAYSGWCRQNGHLDRAGHFSKLFLWATDLLFIAECLLQNEKLFKTEERDLIHKNAFCFSHHILVECVCWIGKCNTPLLSTGERHFVSGWRLVWYPVSKQRHWGTGASEGTEDGQAKPSLCSARAEKGHKEER